MAVIAYNGKPKQTKPARARSTKSSKTTKVEKKEESK